MCTIARALYVQVKTLRLKIIGHYAVQLAGQLGQRILALLCHLYTCQCLMHVSWGRRSLFRCAHLHMCACSDVCEVHWAAGVAVSRFGRKLLTLTCCTGMSECGSCFVCCVHQTNARPIQGPWRESHIACIGNIPQLARQEIARQLHNKSVS